jgi:hypothetical protein
MKGTPKSVLSYRQNMYREPIGRDILTNLHEQSLFMAGRKASA